MMMINGSCEDFLRDDFRNSVLTTYLFDRRVADISSEEQLMQALHSLLSVNQQGTRMCTPNPSKPDACAGLGFRYKTIEVEGNCGTSDWDCPPEQITIWTD